MPSEGVIDGTGTTLRFPAAIAESLGVSSNFIDGILSSISVGGRGGSSRSLLFGEIGITWGSESLCNETPPAEVMGDEGGECVDGDEGDDEDEERGERWGQRRVVVDMKKIVGLPYFVPVSRRCESEHGALRYCSRGPSEVLVRVGHVGAPARRSWRRRLN